MEKLPIPDKFEVTKIGTHHANIIIEPCYPGYGTTLGNALRRVLLSSLPGAAITAIKIKGVTHEFSTLPNVKEDIVEIILNLKRIRFRLFNVDEAQATLKVKGEKKVTAKDIKCTSDVEVITPDAEIATLTDKNAELEIEFFLNTGRGYLPVENVEKKKFPLGTIVIDAIFTPIKNVNYSIESVRVGQMTNFDRLVLGVSTDGTISPEDAVKLAAGILVEHFSTISQIDKPSKSPVADQLSPEAKIEEKEEEKNVISDAMKAEPKAKKKRGRPKKE